MLEQATRLPNVGRILTPISPKKQKTGKPKTDQSRHHTNHHLIMRNRIILFALAIAMAFFSASGRCLAQSSPAKNVVSTHRVFPKIDKVAEFEKALAAHAQKYHSGDNFWRVFQIQSGPDFGGYQITEGPKTWESEDARGDLGADHMADWNKNVAIHLTERQSATFAIYQDTLSTVALGDFSDKVQITHVYPKPGRSDDVIGIIKKLKKSWEIGGQTVAVYALNASGPAQFTLVTRYKQGLKEKAPDFRKPFKTSYEAANGAGSYVHYQKDIAEFVQEAWAELLFLRKELGSK